MPILNWLGRDEALKTAAKTPYRLLEEVPELGYGDKSTDNMIIQGDNLEALKALLPFYAGQVKCIYIDPPYNTGSRIDSDGKEVGYDDNLEHSTWISMMYPRLELLKDLLDERGLLAVQIDDDEFAHLFMIMAEIFGLKNLKIISVKMSEATGVKMASVNKVGSIPKIKEFIILASKSGIKNLNIEMIPKEKWDNEYKTLCLGVTKDELNFVKQVMNDDNRISDDMHKLERIIAKISFVNAKKYCQNSGIKYSLDWLYDNAWRIVQIATLTGGARTLAEKEKNRRKDDVSDVFPIITSKNKMYLIKKEFNTDTSLPRCKILFADLYLTINPGDFWQDIKTTGLDNEGVVKFKKGKKPEALVKRIIKMSTNPNDLVLDSFLGSGTTAAVAQKMGRRYIGIEMGNHAITHCVPRLKAVVDGEQGGISKAVNWQGGGGFRFYKLGNEVFDADGCINEGISFEDLSAHIWFTETKTPFNKPAEKSTFLGIKDNIAYALLYNGILKDKRVDGGNVLTNKTLKVILDDMQNAPYDKLVIYGESSRISQPRLKSLNIEFKQTPYDIKAR